MTFFFFFSFTGGAGAGGAGGVPSLERDFFEEKAFLISRLKDLAFGVGVTGVGVGFLSGNSGARLGGLDLAEPASNTVSKTICE